VAPGRYKLGIPFIVFEGLDGSGKSTLMQAFEERLKQSGVAVVRTREPGGTGLGDEIRNMILRKDGPVPCARAELLLYEASRAQHVDELIRPALNAGSWVLCDRFSASSVAFQAGGRSIAVEWVEKLNEFATDNLEADLTVLLDLSVAESKRRRSQRQTQSGSSEDRIESEAEAFHERVRHSFLEQARNNPRKWLVLDASLSPAELLEKLVSHLSGLSWRGSSIKS
jgi:dTMP kinase